MKQLMVIGVVLLSWLSGGVMADCTTTQILNDGSLATLLAGKTINADSPGGENWNEQHIGSAGGALNKVGLGCGNAVDGTVQVGTWNVSGTGTDSRVVYTYTGGSPYSWSVHDNGDGSYTFCDAPGGSEIATGNLSTNAAPCP